MAATVCGECHVIEKGVRDRDSGGAPSFQSVADNPAMTALALRVFLRTPHDDMPDLILSDAETDDLIAYILGLKRRP